MARVKFTAKSTLPADKGGKRYLYRKAGKAYVKYGDGETLRILPPVYFESGKSYDVEDWEADWLLKHTNGIFSTAATPTRAKKTEKTPAKSESET